ncbi:hypothetical protein [Sphaerisporangium corydalis]|uniref:Uncharacterized protein n=1 Tax=Sphaerisporangium corydalis TaxID=1441875 RepID=A0ABV9ELL3_9ACTN|nr:hypothetical protein [Sphaerisporangium corydalis]
MSIEEELKEAMAARVADVRAPAMMGAAVRRRHRSHVVRFRTAGAAALTVVVAGAFPAYTALTSGPSSLGGGPAAGPTEPAVPPSDASLVPPSDAPPVTPSGDPTTGFTPGVPSGDPTTGFSPGVPSESPPDGVDMASPEPMPSDAFTAAPNDRPTGMPQDLGDLGDGREFGGIRLGYLPDFLKWGGWSGKNGFGVTSYTTTFDEPGAKDGVYGVQVVVFEGQAAQRVKPLLRTYRAASERRVSVHGAEGALAALGEGSEVTEDNSGTPTIVWFPKRDLAIEVMISPVLAERLGAKDTRRELKKIANGVGVTD